MNPAFFDYLFGTFAFVVGAVVGSFLNVCIYRMPLDMSVNEPRRSFCPSCKKQIPWYRNLPLISWLVLRGRCAECRAPISARYFVVELLTAVLFLGVWLHTPLPSLLWLPYWVLVSLLIVATFIDLEHFIIPNEITWGGTAAGIVFSFLLPQMMETPGRSVDGPLWGGLWSIIGAAVGFFLLWGVVEAGKIAFGKRRLKLDQPTDFSWVRKGDDAELKLGDESQRWSETFSRESDQLIMICQEAEVAGTSYQAGTLTFFHDRVLVDGAEHKLDILDTISGRVTEVIIPREAMGFGDVKFIAAIGAFLGWQAVLFTVFTASIVGSVVGLTAILIGRREASAKIPFGPYLALGALIWLFCGWPLLILYFNSLQL